MHIILASLYFTRCLSLFLSPFHFFMFSSFFELDWNEKLASRTQQRLHTTYHLNDVGFYRFVFIINKLYAVENLTWIN